MRVLQQRTVLTKSELIVYLNVYLILVGSFLILSLPHWGDLCGPSTACAIFPSLLSLSTFQLLWYANDDFSQRFALCWIFLCTKRINSRRSGARQSDLLVPNFILIPPDKCWNFRIPRGIAFLSKFRTVAQSVTFLLKQPACFIQRTNYPYGYYPRILNQSFHLHSIEDWLAYLG